MRDERMAHWLTTQAEQAAPVREVWVDANTGTESWILYVRGLWPVPLATSKNAGPYTGDWGPRSNSK